MQLHSTVNRLTIASILSIAALLAPGIGHRTTAHAANSETTSLFPNGNLQDYYGLNSVFFWWDKTSGNTVSPYADTCQAYVPPGYAHTGGTCAGSNYLDNPPYDAGGNYYVTSYANWENWADKYGQHFNCWPRQIEYSFGQTYGYWGSGPDTRCADFRINHDGLGTTCNGFNEYQSSLSMVVSYNNVAIGKWVVYYTVGYKAGGWGINPCSFLINSTFTFQCYSGIYCQNQLTGKNTPLAGEVTDYAGSGTQFLQTFNTNLNGRTACYSDGTCTNGEEDMYVRVQEQGGPYLTFYAKLDWSPEEVTLGPGPTVCCRPVSSP